MLSRLSEIKKSEKGFTLIELLIVIVIIGVLAAVAVPTYSRYITSARAAEAPQILTAMITYARGYSSAHDDTLPAAIPTELSSNAEYFTYSYTSPTVLATGSTSPFTGDDTLNYNMSTDTWDSAGSLVEVQPSN